MKYLSGSGLEYLWTRIREAINESAASGGGTSAGCFYAVCSTAGTQVSKVVSADGFTLTQGALLCVTFSDPVPASSTLNVNATGAKAILYRGQAITDDIVSAGSTALLLYDGTEYLVLSVDYPDASEVTY